MTYSFKPLTETKLVILDHNGLHRSYIIQALKDYKSRWGESLATNVLVATTTAEVPPYIPVIVTTYYYDELPSLFTNVITVDSLQFLTRNHLRQAVINPQVTYTKDPVEALALLNSLKSPFAYDCETAKADNVEPIKKVKLALDPFRNQLTMFSFADNESTAFVISNESKEMEDLVLNFLTSTPHKVIMHNSSFDMKIVKHRTGKFIKNFEDSLLMHRILLNHTGDSNQTLVGLKKLAGSVYGSWAVAKDLFGIEHKYNPELIHYSGIDAMATMYVYNEALASGEFNNLPDNFPQMDNSFFPIGKPQKMRHTKNFFYTNIVKPQIPATIDLMLQGITIDFNAVTKLSTTVDTVVQQVLDNLHNNKRVQQFS
jgi:DNA polymerase III epsilon subunit-like protein